MYLKTVSMFNLDCALDVILINNVTIKRTNLVEIIIKRLEIND
jgi:hypothetical protein